MFPTVTEHGTAETATLLRGVETRLLNQAPAWRMLRQDAAEVQKSWWSSDGDGTWAPAKDATLARDKRKDSKKRDPAVMVATGNLRRAATSASSYKVGSDYLFLGIGYGAGRHDAHYGLYLADSGRDPLGLPDEAEVSRYAEAVGEFILTGMPRRA